MHRKKKASQAGRAKRAHSSRASGQSLQPAPQEAAEVMQQSTALRPRLAIVLGSGFQGVRDAMEADCDLPYSRLPGFATPAVGGHAGRFSCGMLGGTPVAVLAGRAHFYEGHDMEQVTFGVRALAAFGVQDLVLTSAAGGLNPAFEVGDFMLLTDHINFMGANPLRRRYEDQADAFVDLTAAYDRDLAYLFRLAARKTRITLREGVYFAVAGPSYETPAEVRAFRTLGADAVGMSTVPEVITARQHELRVAAISCITNLAAGISQGPLSHNEVLETGRRLNATSIELLAAFARLYGQEDSDQAG